MKILGVYNRTIERDEKTGYTKFTVKTEEDIADPRYGTIICQGIIPLYPVNTPLEIDIEKNDTDVSYKIISCIPKSGGEATTLSFLSSEYFNNIGPTLARQIIEKIGEDVFEFVQKENAFSRLMEIPRMPEDAAKMLIKKVKNLVSLQEIVTYITTLGGNYFQAVDIYEMFGEKSLEVIHNNPYILSIANLPFYVCEAIAKKNNINWYEPMRITALVNHVMNQNRQNGNTRIEYNELINKVHNTEKYANMGYHTKDLFIEAEITDKRFVLEEDNGKVYVYYKKDYQIEMIINKEIKRLITSAKFFQNGKATIEDIEKICNITYDKDQRKVFDTTKKGGISIISGGPGTGKTSTLNGLLKKFEIENPSIEIVLCAPTGCAAKRMQVSTGRQAFTIHSLLDIKPFDKDIYMTGEQLTADVVIVDEVSMVDAELMAKLLKSIKNGAKLILQGDKDQLSSVGAGNVLHDLLESNIIKETYILETVHRQKNENKIIENSKRIKKGNSNLINDNSFVIHRFFKEEDMVEAAVKNAKRLYMLNQGNVKLFTPARKRKFACSSVNLNKEMKEYLKPSDKESLSCNGYKFSVGDKVIFTSNNSQKGYWNGEEGYVTDIQIHGLKKYMTIQIIEGEEISICGNDLNNVELGYAITAHKSQGSECDTAIILVPKNPAKLLERSLLYVEVTRAKNKVELYVEDNALELAIKNAGDKKRNTGLVNKLIKVA